MRTRAYCAMSTLASRMSDARPRARRTQPGSPERVACAELRTSMNDQRAAFCIAVDHGETSRMDRNGFVRKNLPHGEEAA